MSRQSVSVEGRLFCNSQASTSKQTAVQLVNKRFGYEDIQKGYPEYDGTFMLTLTVDRNFAMTPELEVHTSCAAPTPCTRVIKFRVPDEYVNRTTPYNKGDVHLEAKQDNEATRC